MLPCSTGPTLVAHGSDTRAPRVRHPSKCKIATFRHRYYNCLFILAFELFSNTSFPCLVLFVFHSCHSIPVCTHDTLFFRSVAATHVATTLNQNRLTEIIIVFLNTGMSPANKSNQSILRLGVPQIRANGWCWPEGPRWPSRRTGSNRRSFLSELPPNSNRRPQHC